VSEDVRMIDKVTRVVNLYDLYGTLLTERQREMVEMYYFDDWSLAEVADHLGVSRQAVHDNIRRAEEQLEAYEKALSLLKRNHAVTAVVRELIQVWTHLQHQLPEDQQVKVQELLTALTSELEITLGRGDERA
jgi:predicted DNA-binding protein YlxM (UPF0122 family)